MMPAWGLRDVLELSGWEAPSANRHPHTVAVSPSQDLANAVTVARCYDV